MTTTDSAPVLRRNIGYLLWLASDTSSELAGAITAFALPLIALAATGDPAQAGVIAAVGIVARLAAMLYGGVLADRHRRIAMMMLGAAIGTVLAAALVLLALWGAFTTATLLAIQTLLMVRAGLFEPASESVVKSVVPDAAMGRAQAANQGRDAALQLAGGPLGGLLLGAGAWLVGVAAAVGYAVATAAAWMLNGRARRTGILDRPARPTANAAPSGASPRTRAGGEIRAGFAWLLSRPDLGGVLVVVTVVNLGLNVGVTTAVYAMQQAGHSALTIGTVSSAVGAVMLVGALVAPILVPRVKAGTIMVAGLALATGGIVALSMLTEPWAIATTLGISVALLPAVNAALMGYFMVATPSDLLGRANSAAGILGMGAMPLAPAIAGFGLSLLGRQTTVLVGAALCIVAVVLAVTNRPLRALPAEAGWSAHATRLTAASTTTGR